MLLVAFLIQECLNSCTLHTSQQKSFIHIRVFCRADSLLLICLCVVSYVASIASLSLRIFCACVCPILIFFRNLLIPGASMILHVINNFNFLRETHTVSLPLSSLLVSSCDFDGFGFLSSFLVLDTLTKLCSALSVSIFCLSLWQDKQKATL